MMTIEVALEEPLLTKLDHAASTLAITRADLIRDAVEAMLRRIEIKMLEERDRAGYERDPITPEEFGDWEAVRDWGPE